MKNNFKDELKLIEDKEKLRILDLQTKFKKGLISEKDLDDDDYIKLLQLYEEQNNKLKSEIEKYKKETESFIKTIKN